MRKIGLILAVLVMGCSASNSEDASRAAGAELSGVLGSTVPVRYEVQEKTYWCGPAATRMTLSARMSDPPTQAQLARELPTDEDGTDWIGQITVVLNKYLGPDRYKTVEMPNDPPTAEQRDQLWRDIVNSIDRGYPVVTNIWAPPHNHPPGYPNRYVKHYFLVNGYDESTSRVFISDSANFSGNKQYWLSFAQLATLIPPKGYSALAETGTTADAGVPDASAN